jgi:hypothetical protein
VSELLRIEALLVELWVMRVMPVNRVGGGVWAIRVLPVTRVGWGGGGVGFGWRSGAKMDDEARAEVRRTLVHVVDGLQDL